MNAPEQLWYITVEVRKNKTDSLSELKPLRVESKFEPCTQNKIMTPFKASLQNFRGISPSLLYWDPLW